MYLYLSILNNKVTYIQDYDVHHINGNKLDNRIQNLQLIKHPKHITDHKTKNMDNRRCLLCGRGKTQPRITKMGKRPNWYDDINGFLCRYCYLKIRYYRKKFGII